ncbi:MAG: DUF58 domain-containing protein [Actinomycetota bacterium]|nr:DUF58 domain-containing protein [Actinomycetota bacterium]
MGRRALTPLTRRGWAVIAGSFAVATLGRTLGVVELFVLASGGMGLVAVGVITVIVQRTVNLEGSRRLVPPRVHAGSDSRVELTVLNRGRRTSPVVMLRDSVVQVKAPRAGDDQVVDSSTPTRQARFHVAPLQPDETNRAAYRLGAERRGLFRVGPLEVVVADPFGLASFTRRVAPATEFTVYPRVEPVAAPPLTTGHDPRTGAGHASLLGSGDEFYGLRAYEVGDDLRRVHWPSTARQDELMIRQHELPWQGRATVLLDVRAAVHSEESFEEAVSAAASLVTACWRRDSQVRLLTTDGLDSGFGGGPAHLSALMEHLAVLEPGTGRMDTLPGALRRRASGALVLVTTAGGGTGQLEQVGLGAVGFGWAGVVLIEAGGRNDGNRLQRAPVANGAGRSRLVVHVRAGESFGPAWNAAVTKTPVAGMRR